MPKRWRIVPSETARLGAASGRESGGGQSGKFEVEVYLDRGKFTTLPWKWDSKQEARDAIEGDEGWKKAEVKEK